MMLDDQILIQIKEKVRQVNPNATVILYGSRARGDNRADSDFDILILLDKQKLTWNDKKILTYPLYELEFEIGKIISPIVLSKKDWEQRHRITPFYHNIKREGVLL